MPEDNGSLNLKSGGSVVSAAIERVMGRIRDIEFSGQQVPDSITVEID